MRAPDARRQLTVIEETELTTEPEQARDEAAAVPDFDGRYVDVRLLRERGITCSFQAVEPQTGRAVFIKLLRAELAADAQLQRIFCREPALLRLLMQTAPEVPIMPVLDMGRWHGRPFFVQPLLTGWSLEQLPRERGGLAGLSVLRIIEGCLLSLNALHSAGVVHGDISPDNIFIETDAPPPADGRLPEACAVRLLDFNSARRMDEELRPDAVLFLKPVYAAPELAHGQPLSPQTDLYSLGVVMYELLTGVHLYQGSTQVWGGLVADDLPALSLLYSVPPPIEEFVRGLCQRAPHERTKSAAEALRQLRVLRALHEWLAADRAPEAPAHLLRPPMAAAHESPSTIRFQPRVQGGLDSTPTAVNYPPPPITIQPATGAYISPTQEAAPTGAPPVITEQVGPIVKSVMPDKHTDDEAERVPVSAAYNVQVPRASVGLLAEPEIDLVQFSVFAPAKVAPARSFVLEVWAYNREQRDEVLQLATRARRLIERGSRANVRIPARKQLTLVLHLDGFVVKEPQDSFFWCGEFVNASFIVDVPPALAPGDYPGQINILHDGLLLWRIVFEITVGADSGAQMTLRARQQLFRTAFASYASADRAEVLRRVQGLSAAGVDVFLDVIALRAGQQWEEELFENIRQRDIFYLFWSEAARASEWVEREWRYALSEKGLDYIHPIPLVDPRSAPPPRELASRHFNDLLLAWLNNHKPATGEDGGATDLN